jgi:hypothetical protein
MLSEPSDGPLLPVATASSPGFSTREQNYCASVGTADIPWVSVLLQWWVLSIVSRVFVFHSVRFHLATSSPSAATL